MTPEPAWFAGDQGALWVIAHPALEEGILGHRAQKLCVPKKKSL